MSWPFKLTPREAFYPDRVELIERLFSLLESVISGQGEGGDGECLAGLAVRLIEAGQDLPKLITEDLSKLLLKSGPLDFMAACLLESPDLVDNVLAVPVVSTGNLDSISGFQDDIQVILTELSEDAQDLGWASLAVRLHLKPGIDRYPYLMALLKFVNPSLKEITRDKAPFEFQCYPLGSQVGSPQWRLLWDYAADEGDPIVRLDSGRKEPEEVDQWRTSYRDALTHFERRVLSSLQRERPAMVIDRMLLDLVYEPMLPWIFSGAPLEKLHKKYQPIIREILIHQGISEALHAVLERHIWINALAVSPDALRSAGCTLDDLLPPVDSMRGVFGQKEAPLFIQGPMGVFWSYENSYIIDFRRCLEDVVGPITLKAMVNSHFISGEAVTLFLQDGDLSESQASAEHCEVRQVLASPKMNDIVNNPFQSASGLNRIFQYASLLPDAYDRDALIKLFLNRLVTVIQEKRHLMANTYVDLRLFVQRSGCPEALLRAALQHKDQDLLGRKGVASMMVDLFGLRSSDLRKLGPGAPAWLREQLISADLGL